MRRRSAILGLALAALVPGSAPAHVSDEFTGGSGVFLVTGSPTARVVAQTRSVVTVSGEMVVTFEGDPATCASAGRCDTRGTLTWRPSGSHNLYLSDIADRRRRSVAASFFPDDFSSSETISQVRRARSGGGTALCSDAQGVSSGGLDAVIIGEQLVFGVDPTSSGPLDSRCGGPLWEDVRYVLPRPRWDLAEFRERGGAADLRAEQSFVAGGLRGTVLSTVVARLTRPRKIRPDGGTSGSDGREPRFRTQTWRVRSVSGSVRLDIRGAEAPARCEPLDACGLAGTVTVAPKPRLKDAEVFAFVAERPFDETRFAGGGGWIDTGSATATFTRPDAPAPCADTVGLQGASLRLLEQRGRVAVTYDPFPGVRSRCAGPVLGSLFDAGTASASVPLRRFERSRRVTLRLTRGTSRTTEGYRIASYPDLTIELVRRR